MWIGRGDSNTEERNWPERAAEEKWSGIRESNPRLDLGKVAYYHYTNPARRAISLRHCFYSMAPTPGQVRRQESFKAGNHKRPRAIARLAPERQEAISPLP